jgi:hypothetical protein
MATVIDALLPDPDDPAADPDGADVAVDPLLFLDDELHAAASTARRLPRPKTFPLVVTSIASGHYGTEALRPATITKKRYQRQVTSGEAQT